MPPVIIAAAYIAAAYSVASYIVLAVIAPPLNYRRRNDARDSSAEGRP
jgi:hypothetical protein